MRPQKHQSPEASSNDSTFHSGTTVTSGLCQRLRPPRSPTQWRPKGALLDTVPYTEELSYDVSKYTADAEHGWNPLETRKSPPLLQSYYLKGFLNTQI